MSLIKSHIHNNLFDLFTAIYCNKYIVCWLVNIVVTFKWFIFQLLLSFLSLSKQTSEGNTNKKTLTSYNKKLIVSEIRWLWVKWILIDNQRSGQVCLSKQYKWRKKNRVHFFPLKILRNWLIICACLCPVFIYTYDSLKQWTSSFGVVSSFFPLFVSHLKL